MSNGHVLPHEASMAALVSMQQHSEAARATAERIRDWLEGLSVPARMQTVALTAAEPIKRLEEGITALSVAVYNPSPATISLGIGGGSATLAARAPSVPPSCALVLPIAVEDLEVGADPAELAAGDAVFFVLRFPAVQQFFFGGI